jgi:3-hydroxybutyryl-CoA dehydrogenase
MQFHGQKQNDMKIGIIGSGTMGNGIAQLAAQSGHAVVVSDNNLAALEKAQAQLNKILNRLVEKGKVTQEEMDATVKRISYETDLTSFDDCGLVIEAIIENLDIKKSVFRSLEQIISLSAILASNTSSLSIASIAAACEHPERIMGIHFFNPAPLMPLVEIVPAIQSDPQVVQRAKAIIDSWGKLTVMAKDTPGFIVNRVARPFYGEALRIYEEGFVPEGPVGFATIDTAMKELGGFRMGPFELMDFIGNDVNYAVTASTFQAFYYDPRYKPSFTQKNLSEAGWLGRKTGRGYYNYAEGAVAPEPLADQTLKENIAWRIVVMLINEAADALYLNIASRDDIDLAMTKGVNYPKGLLKWADEKGIQHCVDTLDRLYDEYHEDRYRCSSLLRRMARNGESFYG